MYAIGIRTTSRSRSKCLKNLKFYRNLLKDQRLQNQVNTNTRISPEQTEPILFAAGVSTINKKRKWSIAVITPARVRYALIKTFQSLAILATWTICGANSAMWRPTCGTRGENFINSGPPTTP